MLSSVWTIKCNALGEHAGCAAGLQSRCGCSRRSSCSSGRPRHPLPSPPVRAEPMSSPRCVSANPCSSHHAALHPPTGTHDVQSYQIREVSPPCSDPCECFKAYSMPVYHRCAPPPRCGPSRALDHPSWAGHAVLTLQMLPRCLSKSLHVTKGSAQAFTVTLHIVPCNHKSSSSPNPIYAQGHALAASPAFSHRLPHVLPRPHGFDPERFAPRPLLDPNPKYTLTDREACAQGHIVAMSPAFSHRLPHVLAHWGGNPTTQQLLKKALKADMEAPMRAGARGGDAPGVLAPPAARARALRWYPYNPATPQKNPKSRHGGAHARRGTWWRRPRRPRTACRTCSRTGVVPLQPSNSSKKP